jgi:hypothetical protein
LTWVEAWTYIRAKARVRQERDGCPQTVEVISMTSTFHSADFLEPHIPHHLCNVMSFACRSRGLEDLVDIPKVAILPVSQVIKSMDQSFILYNTLVT